VNGAPIPVSSTETIGSSGSSVVANSVAVLSPVEAGRNSISKMHAH
jgi:hypothetical protein